jgi:hypothetical protein
MEDLLNKLFDVPTIADKITYIFAGVYSERICSESNPMASAVSP